MSVTFGKSSIGANSEHWSNSRERLCFFTSVGAGKVKRLEIFLADGGEVAGATQRIKGLLYADGGGKPGLLLGETPEFTITAPVTEGWLSLPFASSIEIPGGTYWIGTLAGGSGTQAKTSVYKWDSVASGRQYAARTFTSGAAPNGEELVWTTDGLQTSLIAVYNPAPTVTKPPNQETEKGKPASLQIEAIEASKYTASGLPAGLSISETTGLITGTPTTAEAPEVTITVEGLGGKATTTFLWKITSGTALPTIAEPAEQVNTVEEPLVGLQLIATNATEYKWSNQPAGLSLSSSTGKITGTPSVVQTKKVAIVVKGPGGEASTAFTWKIVAIPTVTKPADQESHTGQATSLPIGATSAARYEASALPAGLTINPTTGVISGTPEVVTASIVTVIVKNEAAVHEETALRSIGLVWGSGAKGALGGGWENAGLFPYAEVLALPGIEQMASPAYAVLSLVNHEVLFNGPNYMGQAGNGEVTNPATFLLSPTKVTGGIQLWDERSWPTAFIPGAPNFRSKGPNGPALGKIAAVAGHGGASFALREEPQKRALAWGNNGTGMLANGWRGFQNIEAVKQPTLVHRDEEAGVLRLQLSPDYVRTGFNSELAAVAGKTGHEFGVFGNESKWNKAVPSMLGERSGTVKVKSWSYSTKLVATVKAATTKGSKVITIATLAEAEKLSVGLEVEGAGSTKVPEGVLWPGATIVKITGTSVELSDPARYTVAAETVKAEKITIGEGTANPLSVSMTITGDVVIETEGWNPLNEVQMMIYVRQDKNGKHKISISGIKWGSEGTPVFNEEAWAINQIALHSDGKGNIYGAHIKPLEGIRAIAVGHQLTLYLLESGEIYFSGGPFASEGESCLAQPLQLMRGASGGKIVAISTGAEAGIALTESGEVQTFGHNAFGLLGNGKKGEAGSLVATPEREVSPGVFEPLKGVIAVAAEESHMIVAKSDGTCWTWGRNRFGEIGNGTISTENATAVTRPTLVPCGGGAGELPNPATNPVVAVSAGGEPLVGEGIVGCSCNIVLLKDGTVRTWGGNTEGQLGDLTLEGKTRPVQPPGVSEVIGINAASGLTMQAIKRAGVATSPPVEVIPAPGEATTAVLVLWRPIASFVELRPEGSWKVNFVRASIGPQSAEEIELEYLPNEKNKEGKHNGASLGATVHEFLIKVSELSAPWTGSTNEIEATVVGKPPTDKPANTLKFEGTEVVGGKTIYKWLVSWTGTDYSPLQNERNYHVRWRRTTTYTNKKGEAGVFEPFSDSGYLPGGSGAHTYLLHLEPFSTAGGTPAELTGGEHEAELDVEVLGAYEGSFQTRTAYGSPL